MNRPGRMIAEVMKWVFGKPATENYPAVKKTKAPAFRGKLVFTPATCTGCKLCMRDCPAAAIEIRTLAPKKFAARIKLGDCIYCGQCVASCPRKSLTMSNEFELAGFTQEQLVIDYLPAESAPVISKQ